MLMLLLSPTLVLTFLEVCVLSCLSLLSYNFQQFQIVHIMCLVLNSCKYYIVRSCTLCCKYKKKTELNQNNLFGSTLFYIVCKNLKVSIGYKLKQQLLTNEVTKLSFSSYISIVM